MRWCVLRGFDYIYEIIYYYSNLEYPFSNPLQRPYSSNAHRNPLLNLKIVPKAGYDKYTEKIYQWQRSTDKNLPIAEKQRWKSRKGREKKLDRNSYAASGITFRISKYFIRSKHKLSINFLFKKAAWI
jgi:hypothetical protein